MVWQLWLLALQWPTFQSDVLLFVNKVEMPALD